MDRLSISTESLDRLSISTELRQKMRKRDFPKKQAVKQNSHQMWNDYKKIRNDENASIRVARTNFFKVSVKKHSGITLKKLGR